MPYMMHKVLISHYEEQESAVDQTLRFSTMYSGLLAYTPAVWGANIPALLAKPCGGMYVIYNFGLSMHLTF